MAKRVSQTKVMVEEVDSTNYKRASQLKTMVEYEYTTNFKQISQLKVMVEYVENPVSALTYGPRVQNIS